MPTDLPQAGVAVVLGTRPEVVKLAGVLRLLGAAAVTIHTGQHYDAGLSEVFFGELGLERPRHHLGVGGTSRGAQIGEATRLLDALLADVQPRAVVVQGDTNATLAGAIAANAREIPLVHVEAGLRSFDRAMPEEHNRVLADHLADLCCAPTEVNRANLAAEGIGEERVVVTGNTVIEALQRLLPGPEERAGALAGLGLEPARFVLATIHRPENVDDPAPLRRILTELAALPLPVVLPLHPRTRDRMDRFGLAGLAEGLVVTPPLGYRQFLALAAETALVVSDSGGIQEEVSVLKRPIVVVRRSTERPEVLGTFADLVSPEDIGKAAAARLEDVAAEHRRLAALPSPYGDGTASERTVAALVELLAR
jgi:UDP-N-acetylglucosamine 2-epimerase (non-hydrolysing)